MTFPVDPFIPDCDGAPVRVGDYVSLRARSGRWQPDRFRVTRLLVDRGYVEVYDSHRFSRIAWPAADVSRARRGTETIY